MMLEKQLDYVNISKPIFLYGYNIGYNYYEKLDIYTESTFNKNQNKGTMSIFVSLILFTKKINDLYTIYDMGDHRYIRQNLLKNYKKFGLKKLDYEPAIFEMDKPKFVWVRQKYSGFFKHSHVPFKKVVYFDSASFNGIKK